MCCVDWGLYLARLRVWDTDWDDGAGEISGLVWDGTGTGAVLCVPRGANVDCGGPEGTVAVLPQLPIGRFEALDDG